MAFDLSSAATGVRSTLRLWRHQPLYCGVITLTIALVVASTAVAYSVLAGTVLQELPFDRPDRIAAIKASDLETGDPETIPLGLFLRWRESSTSFSELGAYQEYRAFVSPEDGGTTVYSAASATPGFFEVLRVRPALGQPFQESGAALVEGAWPALISHSSWVRDFDRDAEVIGRGLRVNGEPAVVVGVMPEGFAFPSNQEIWLELRTEGTRADRAASQPVLPIGRLAEDASPTAARVELNAIAAAHAADLGEPDRERSISVESFVAARTDPRLRRAVQPMFLAIAAICLLGCANVANIVLGRSANERQTWSLRMALGANRKVLTLTTASEVVTLALMGALAAYPLTVLGVGAFARQAAPARIFHASWIAFEVDGGVVVFLLSMAVGSGLLAAVIPAVYRYRSGPGEMLGKSVRSLGVGRLGVLNRSLLALELALASGLLLVAGVLIQTVIDLRKVDLGVDGSRIVTAKVSTAQARDLDTEASRRFFAELANELESRASVETVAYTTTLPTEGSFRREVTVPGASEPVRVRWMVVSPGFFDAFGVPSLSGRAFREGWTPGRNPREVVVNRSFAERHLDRDPEGAVLRTAGSDSGRQSLTVVGTVEDFVMAPLGEEASPPAVFTSPAQDLRRSMELVVRARPGESGPVARSLCPAAFALHPEAACFDVRTMADVIAQRTWIYDALASLFSSLASVALVLGATGTFGMVSFLASRRRNEMGLRFALGATRRSILGLVFRQLAWPGLAGLAVGLAGGVASTRLLEGLLVGPVVWTPEIVASTAIVLLVPAVLAAYQPARKAAAADPVESLRLE